MLWRVSVAALLFAIGIGALARAQVFGPAVYVAQPAAGGGCSSGSGYKGPGDCLSAAIAWYGLRGYNAAAAASNLKAVLVKSDSHSSETCDIGLGTNGFIGGTGSVTSACSGADNGISLSSFCTSNSDCHVGTIYDQSGNARHVVVSITGCALSVSPLKMICGSGNEYSTSGTISIAQPATASFVAARTSSTSTFNSVISFSTDPTQSGFPNVSGDILLYAGTVVNQTGYTETEEISAQETYDGTSSVVYAHGSVTNINSTGLNPGAGSSTAAAIGLTGGSASGHNLFGDFWEAGIWQGTAANHTNFPYASMTSNQRDATIGWNF